MDFEKSGYLPSLERETLSQTVNEKAEKCPKIPIGHIPDKGNFPRYRFCIHSLKHVELHTKKDPYQSPDTCKEANFPIDRWFHFCATIRVRGKIESRLDSEGKQLRYNEKFSLFSIQYFQINTADCVFAEVHGSGHFHLLQQTHAGKY